MLALPIPFVTSLVLLTLTMVLFQLRKALSINAIVLVFVFVCAVLSGLVAWRWTSDVPLPRLLMPILSSSLGTLAW